MNHMRMALGKYFNNSTVSSITDGLRETEGIRWRGVSKGGDSPFVFRLPFDDFLSSQQGYSFLPFPFLSFPFLLVGPAVLLSSLGSDTTLHPYFKSKWQS